jgi:ceramide glucosyltransferase
MHVLTVVQIALLSGFLASVTYLTFAIIRVATFRHGPGGVSAFQPPVTIAKPICGMDAGLEENLRSFFAQDYPTYQVVFGAQNPHDPALATVRSVMQESTGHDTILTVDPRIIGANRKVSNLAAIFRHAKHDIVVVADSDIRVGSEYLRAIAAPFEDDRVGAVTCLTVAEPCGGLPSKLGAMFINEEFLPAILVSMALQPLTFCFGPTMAARRSALESIGGFQALAAYIADDYMLGHLVTRRGLRVELASCVVKNILHEPTIARLFLHELRWARTIRTVRPLGYAATIFTLITPWALAVLAASGFSRAGWLAVAVALTLRGTLQAAVRSRFHLRGAPGFWWAPVRDLLSFGVYCVSYMGRRVLWRTNRFTVSGDGRLHGESAEA